MRLEWEGNNNKWVIKTTRLGIQDPDETGDGGRDQKEQTDKAEGGKH